MTRRLVFPLALAACGDDLGPSQYSGHFHVEVSRNDPTHTSMVELTLHPQSEVMVRVAGGKAEHDVMGYLSFSTFESPYRLVVSVDGDTVELQHHAEHVELTNRQAGRRHPVPVTKETALTFAPTLPAPALAAGATLAVATTGLWTFTDVGTDLAPTFDWRTAGVVDGERGLLENDDRVFLVAYEPCDGCAAPHRALTRVLDGSIAQVDGEAATITGDLRVPAETLTVTASVHRGEELTRVAPAFPFGPGSGRWGIDSAPAVRLEMLGRLPLVVGTDGNGDVSGPVEVHNPFTGTETVGWLETTFLRPMTISDETSVMLPHGTLHLVPAVAEMSLVGTCGVPGTPKIEVLDNNFDRAVTWEQVIPGRVDDHLVTLFELVDDPAAPLQLVRTIITDERRAVIAGNLLDPERLYIVRVQARIGFPFGSLNADYVDVELPFGHATTWSGAFTR